MKEVVAVVRKSRRCVELWIANGEFPKPVKMGKNSIVFPLEDLKAWARKKSETMEAEFDRLAFAPATDLRPEALPKQIAKQIQRETGEKPEYIMYSAARPATPQEVDAIRAASFMQIVEAMKALIAVLDPIEAIGVVYGFFEMLQPMIDETITRHRPDIKMPKGDAAYQLAISILAATPQEREALRQKRPPHLRELKKTKDAA
jgi:predicted DNA-binding transcriptional regulator AlpA